MIKEQSKENLETEFFNKYKDEELEFKSYNKFSFFFSNQRISIAVGGSSDEIYEASLRRVMKLSDIAKEAPISAFKEEGGDWVWLF